MAAATGRAESALELSLGFREIWAFEKPNIGAFAPVGDTVRYVTVTVNILQFISSEQWCIRGTLYCTVQSYFTALLYISHGR